MSLVQQRGPEPAPDHGVVQLAFQRRVHDVGRGMQVAFVVTAHELAVLGERHVALDDTCAHARPRLVGFLRVLGKLQAGYRDLQLKSWYVETDHSDI